MATKKPSLNRFSIVSNKPFEDVVAAIESKMGHPDLNVMYERLNGAKSFLEYKTIIDEAAGEFGLIQFARQSLGAIPLGHTIPSSHNVVRLVAGNPLMAKEINSRVPDVGSNSKSFHILVEELADGVHVSHSLMESRLEPYCNAEATQIAREFDARIVELLTSAIA